MGLFWLYCSIQKNGCAIKSPKKFAWIAKLGPLVMPYPFFQKSSPTSFVSKREEKINQIKIFQNHAPIF